MKTLKKNLIPREKYEKWFAELHSDKCLLCQVDQQIVIKEWEHWVWVANISPYFDYHTMVIPRRHILHLSHIQPEEWEEFRKVYDHVLDRYSKAGLFLESGQPVKKYLWFVRSRDYNFDFSDDISRPDHLHVHVAPDWKGMFDPILHLNAYKKNGFWEKLKE